MHLRDGIKNFIILLFCSLLFLAGAGCSKSSGNNPCSGSTFYIPNSFEPNGNGINETFGPKGTGIASFEMWIFDGNGVQIYHCTSINNPWNGTPDNSSNTICTEGTYIYRMNVTDASGYSHTYNGTLLLIK